MARTTWFQALAVARQLSKGGKGFTAHDLTKAAGLDDVTVASAWLYKFKLWGYVDVIGSAPSSGIRPLNVYAVTQKGHACKERDGRELQLRRVLEAVRTFQKARGTPSEARVYANLIKVCDEVEG